MTTAHADPVTPDQWRAAVNAADFFLAVHAAHGYGLVTGGRTVNVDRCHEILRRGAELGYRPAPNFGLDEPPS